MIKYKLKLSAEFSDMFYTTLLPFKTLSDSYINLVHAKLYHFLNIAICFPYSFQKFDSPKEIAEVRKIVIDKRFLVFFKVVDNVINVVYFVDGRRSPEHLLMY